MFQKELKLNLSKGSNTKQSKTIVNSINKEIFDKDVESGILFLFSTDPKVSIILETDQKFEKMVHKNKVFSNPKISSTTKASLFNYHIFLPIMDKNVVLSNNGESKIEYERSINFFSFAEKEKEVTVVVCILVGESQERYSKQFSLKENVGCILNTQKIESALRGPLNNTKNGLGFIFSNDNPDIALSLNENWDPTVRTDLYNSMNDICEKKNDLKSVIVGSSLILPISKSSFDSGTWQGIYTIFQKHKQGTFLSYFLPLHKHFSSFSVNVKGKRAVHCLLDLDKSNLIMKEVAKYEVGIIHFFTMHTSATIAIGDNTKEGIKMESELSEIIKEDMNYYLHTYEGSDDCPGHIKTSFLGHSKSIPIKNGQLVLGKTQKLLFAEFRDYPRRRTIKIVINGIKKHK